MGMLGRLAGSDSRADYTLDFAKFSA